MRRLRRRDLLSDGVNHLRNLRCWSVLGLGGGRVHALRCRLLPRIERRVPVLGLRHGLLPGEHRLGAVPRLRRRLLLGGLGNGLFELRGRYLPN